jgi:hypothetical protein
MSIEMRLYQAQDSVQVERLFTLCQEDTSLLHLLESPSLVSAFTVYVDDVLAGFTLAWKRKVYPYYLYFRLLIHPAFYHMNISEQLLNQLQSEKNRDLPLQTFVKDSETELNYFFQSTNFIKIRKTYIPVLNIMESATPEIEKDLHQYEWITMNEARSHKQLMGKLWLKKYMKKSTQPIL